jgi:uncharacterized RDD family membrane protein YckC
MSAYPATTDPTAVVGRRFGAYVIDVIVLFVVPAAIFFGTAQLTFWEDNPPCVLLEQSNNYDPDSEFCIRSTDDTTTTISGETTNNDTVTFKKAAPFLAGGVYLLYLIVVQWIVQGMTGATLGKAVFGIRTVDEQGGAPGLGKQFIRGVLWIVDGLCNGLVALILILASKGHRRLGDMAAKTFVVRSSAKGSPIVVPGLTDGSVGAPAMAGAYATTATPPTSAYTPPAPSTMGTTPPMTAPAPTDPTTPATAPTAGAAPDASGPQWDAARNAYIQWDPTSGRWLTYDDAAAEWKPIEGGQPPTPS